MKNKTILLTEQFIRIANKWNSINNRPLKIEKNFNVTPSEIHFIEVVWKNKNINMTKIANCLGITKGSVSQTSASLVKKGILRTVKEEGNKKTIYLVLTDLGLKAAKYHEKMHEMINLKLDEIFKDTDAKDLEEVSRMMERIETYFEDFLKS